MLSLCSRLSHSIKSTIIAFFISNVFLMATAMDNINAFGFLLDSNVNSGTTETITVTLWYNFTIYQCDLTPTTPSEAYVCTGNTWAILGTSSCHKTNTPEYKIMIDNPAAIDEVIIDHVYMWTSDGSAFYTINDWCIPTLSVGDGYDNVAEWIINDNICGSDYTHYNTLCVDNNAFGCSPPQQMLYFDMTFPNSYTWNSAWNGYTNFVINTVSCDPTNDPTKDPTNNPTLFPTIHPTVNPTYDPTINPSMNPTSNPTLYPSINPTLYPSISPTETTYNPSSIPTVSPTFIPSKAPNPTINVVVNYPTDKPTESTTEMTIYNTTHSGKANNDKTVMTIGALNVLQSILVFVMLAMFIFLVCLVLFLCVSKSKKSKKNKILVAEMISMSQETTTQIIADGVESGAMNMIKNVTDFGNINFENDNNVEQEGDDDSDDDGLYDVNNVTAIGNIEDIDNNINNNNNDTDEGGSESNELYDNKNITATSATTQGYSQTADINTFS